MTDALHVLLIEPQEGGQSVRVSHVSRGESRNQILLPAALGRIELQNRSLAWIEIHIQSSTGALVTRSAPLAVRQLDLRAPDPFTPEEVASLIGYIEPPAPAAPAN